MPPCKTSEETNVFVTFRDVYFANQCFELASEQPDITLIGFNGIKIFIIGIDPQNETSGLLLTYPKPQKSEVNYQLVVSLICDPNGPIGSSAEKKFKVENEQIKVTSSSSSGLLKITSQNLNLI